MKKCDNTIISPIDYAEIDIAFELIWRVFQEFVAPDYTKEGIDTFYREYVTNQKFREKFRDGSETMYGVYVKEQLVGVVSVSVKNTISCVFVDSDFHGMGIGKKLIEVVLEILRQRGEKSIRLNASPYAVAFYHKLGFRAIGEQNLYQGIVYTPMEMEL